MVSYAIVHIYFVSVSRVLLHPSNGIKEIRSNDTNDTSHRSGAFNRFMDSARYGVNR